VAAKRGKSQARRNSNGNSAGLPGWAWLILGVVLTIGVVLVAPKYFKGGDGDGFIRPRPNPDAQPAASTADDGDDAIVVDDNQGKSDGEPGAATGSAPKPTQYDFYTLLPGEEVAMSDAELAATAREEAARKASAAPAPAAQPETPARAAVPASTTNPAPASTMATTVAGNDTPYILQAGAFGASGDAEAVKAKIALLGLSARVESARINDKTVYRVRMGPYGTASELAEAKRKLGNGGLPALAIKAK
jgi:cell division protein FtsN